MDNPLLLPAIDFGLGAFVVALACGMAVTGRVVGPLVAAVGAGVAVGGFIYWGV